MRMLKRIVRGTSRKLLNKLALAANSRQQLVLNQTSQTTEAVDCDGRSSRTAAAAAVAGRELSGRYTRAERATGLPATPAAAAAADDNVATTLRCNANRDRATGRAVHQQRNKSAKRSNNKHAKQTQAQAAIKHSTAHAHHNHQLTSSIPEAVLMAAKNRLPPVQFHHVHGPSAQLSKNNCVARRTQSFCQALVFSNRVIWPNERVYIKVLEIAKGWSGTIRFGFTSVDPATLRYQMPKHACPDMTQMGHTWARALADEVVRRNSVIHFSYTTNGFIHYGINNQDCGIFYANVNTNQNLWFVVDVYGLTAAVELIDPRVHNANSTSELDLSLPQHCFNTNDDDDDDDDEVGGGTDADNNANEVVDADEDDIVAAAMSMYKSTGTIYQPARPNRSRATNENGRATLIQAAHRAAESLALRGRKRDVGSNKEVSRNQQRFRRTSPTLYRRGQFHVDPRVVAADRDFRWGTGTHGLAIMSSSMSVAAAAVAEATRAQQLPHLNSAMMPTAQQNIYSPMPGRSNAQQVNQRPPQHQPNDTHDYYQISMSNTYNNSAAAAAAPNNSQDTYQLYQLGTVGEHQSVSRDNNVHSSSTADPAATVRLIDGPPSAVAFSENAICHQLEAVRVGSPTERPNQQQQVAKQASTVTPIAAARKRLNQNGQSTSTGQQWASSSTTTTQTMSSTHKRSSTNDKSKTSSQRQRQLLGDASNQQMPHETKLANGCASAKSTSKSSRSSSKKSASGSISVAHKQQQSASSLNRDRNNNNSPMSKDCPICFERPINCVLYQCGHMCTCYECGVKQWRTQSRTCPICRTVIKDVIKTYMS